MGSLSTEPRIDRSISLDLVGDWGQATFHKILSWLTQEFCDRTGPRSRTRIWSIRGAGVEAVPLVSDGEADLCIATPNKFMRNAVDGKGIFAPYGPMPKLRALAVLPQRDRMILAVHPRFKVQTFEDIRSQKPAMTIASSEDDGTSFIGHITTEILAAHGVTRTALKEWGGSFLPFKRPHECLEAALDGRADAVIQEAVMLPHWNELIEKHGWIPLEFEMSVFDRLSDRPGFNAGTLPSHYWSTHAHPVQALDYADFIILVREDMPDDVAELLTWCLVHKRQTLEKQFEHIPSDKCALTWPIQPSEMVKSSIELHTGAKKVYHELGLLP